MPKISSLGNSGMGQVPPGWDDMATQNTLFDPWPNAPGTDVGQLEPYGNPAYEGYGYPAAGYGQMRRKVVGLAVPKAVNPQLVGWEDPQPRGLKITPRGSINEDSDRFTRAQIAPLQGLRGLGQVVTPAQAEELRMGQVNRVLQEADRLIAAIQRQVASPPLGTPGSTLSGWKTALNTSVNVRARLDAGKFEAVKSNEKFKKWLDAGAALMSLGKEVVAQYDQNGLLNALKYTAYETATTVGSGIVEGGQRALTLIDWLTKPWVLGGLLVGAGAIYVFARSGGALVRVSDGRQQP